MKRIETFMMLLLLCGVLMISGGCNDDDDKTPTTPATYAITGNWAYTMLKGADTWDTGALTFVGSETSGTYTQVNIYSESYTGSYSVSGANVTFSRAGDDSYVGAFTDAANMNGTWKSLANSEDSGTWTATKQ